MGSSPPLPHIVIFPFLSKGHTIPLLHLTHLLHHRHLATVTFVTTPLNVAFLRAHLPSSTAVIQLPFPSPDITNLPPNVESTDQLPSMSLFLPFIAATSLLKPHFDAALSALPTPPTFLISDGFLGWTLQSASILNIPRLVFHGMGAFASTVSSIIFQTNPHANVTSPTQPFPVPGFPGLTLTKSDLSPPFDDLDEKTPLSEFTFGECKLTSASRGLVINSFYKLEGKYLDYLNNKCVRKPNAWCVGPLCLAKPRTELARNELADWLDSRAAMNRPVIYVAFGSQADVSVEQTREISIGLEKSGLDFLWVVRAMSDECRLPTGFERGRVVREWVDQFAILRHGSVRGFVSHCGWNSVMESVCAGVPILAWPMMAEQHLNAKFVTEELGIGLRVRGSDGSKGGLVKSEDVERMVKELVVGEEGRRTAERVGELAAEAEKAMMDEGSSVRVLEEMIEEMSKGRCAMVTENEH